MDIRPMTIVYRVSNVSKLTTTVYINYNRVRQYDSNLYDSQAISANIKIYRK